MSIDRHVRADLSAYLDGALGRAERATVEAHLASCAACRAHLAELRDTARLIAALPHASPSRRLVPHFAAPPAWLAPLRTLTTIASGLSVFLFIASALLANIGFLAQGGATAAAPAAAPAPQGGAGAPAASAAATAGPAQRSNIDSAKSQATSSAPGGFAVQSTQSADAARGESATSGVPALDTRVASRTPALGPNPWIWLVLAIVTGAIAIALQRRLRSA